MPTWTVRDDGRLHDAPRPVYGFPEFNHYDLIYCHDCLRLITIARRVDIPPEAVRWQCSSCHDKRA